MPRNRDLFDDTTMTFGEHLEVLRVHVWRALIGLIIGVVVSLFYGDAVIRILKGPIDAALRRADIDQVEDDLSGIDFTGYLKSLFSGEEKKEEKEPDPPAMEAELRADEMEVEVSLEQLRGLIETMAPGSLKAADDKSAATPQVVSQPLGQFPEGVPIPETLAVHLKYDSNRKMLTWEGELTVEQQQQLLGLSKDEQYLQAAKQLIQAQEKQTAAAESRESERPTGRLVIRSEDIALFKKTAERFRTPVTYKVEEAFMTYIKVSLVSGLVVTSPWVFYQIWLFVAAGLYSHERKYVYVYLPMSIGLFITGAVFCFYFVFPIVLDFLIGFNKWLGIEIQPRLSEYISLVLMLPVMFGISFQLPLVMLFLERIGIITVEGYKSNWRMAVLVIAIASMLLTPSDPTSMLLMMFPLVFLYFGGILLCRFRPGTNVDPLA